MKKITIPPYLNRFVTFYDKGSKKIPDTLVSSRKPVTGLDDIPYPLPSRKCEYTCMAEGNNGVIWYGAKTGLTRYDPNAAYKEDIIMSFSSNRDLPDPHVKALLADGDGVWVLTETGAVHIEMKMLTGEEKALLLLDESVKYVDRRGMYSQKRLSRARHLESAVPYGHSDNDGCFTAGFAIGEMYHYAVLKREKGEDDPETQRIRKIATRACEACLLLMFIHRRGDGFISRSYMIPSEPIPDDGLFYRISGDKAECLNTRFSRKLGIDGLVIDASAPIPDRLSKLYREAGCDGEGIVYKGDTSSDEITLHYLQMLIANEILVPGDPELGEIIKEAVTNSTNHIIDHGFELHESATGKATTWAKWSKAYFEGSVGWSDACLNAGEVLFYLRTAMKITGEDGKWKENYDKLIAEGYADLTVKHLRRFRHFSDLFGTDIYEELMYGDHMLAVSSFWGLSMLETDKELLEKYRTAFKTWRSTLRREHNPGYDFPFILACPDEEIDPNKASMWFRRFNTSRLAAGVRLDNRHDIALKTRWSGEKEISVLLPPDERFISKYDRNPLKFVNEDSGGITCVESCYVYTFAYWIGRFFGYFG